MPTCLAAKLRLAITIQLHDVRLDTIQPVRFADSPQGEASYLPRWLPDKPVEKRATRETGDWCSVST
jgi:hypothetical protein